MLCLSLPAPRKTLLICRRQSRQFSHNQIRFESFFSFKCIFSNFEISKQISKLKKKLAEAESAQPSGPQPSRLQLKTLEEEVKRLKKEVAQKDVELSQKDLDMKILKQRLVEAESQGIAALKISAENTTLRNALEKVHQICGDALIEQQ